MLKRMHIGIRVSSFFKQCCENYVIRSKKKNEQKSIRNSRRVAISETVVLSDAQKKSIDDLYIRNYGKKIPYDWHKHYTAFTGNFDPTYFPEILCIPEFEYFLNMYRSYAKVFEDKNVLPLIAKSVNIRTPEIVLTNTKGMLRNGDFKRITRSEAENLIDCNEKLFCKPSVGSSSGRGCFLVCFLNGVDEYSNKTVSEVIDSLGNDFSIQKVVKNHSSIDKIYSGSLNTFRIITYRWKDNIYHVPAIMRIGRGGHFLDNAHAGGIFIAVDDDGQLHRTAFSEFKDAYTEHPDSHLQFDGYKIEDFPKVLTAAKTMHEAFPQIGCVNWDFALDDTGTPIVIEANVCGGSYWLPQKGHGCGLFGDRTEEILRWIRTMENAKYSERDHYAFGAGIEK